MLDDGEARCLVCPNFEQRKRHYRRIYADQIGFF